MPSLNIRNVDAALLRAFNIEAAKAEKTLRDWVIGILVDAVEWEVATPEAPKKSKPSKSEAHDPKACRVYRCWQCIGLGKKF